VTTRWPATEENKPKAEKLLARLDVQVDDGTFESRTEQKTFAQLATAYLGALTVRALTRCDYEVIINNRLVPYFGPTKLRAVRAQDVEEYRAHAQQTASARGGRLSVRTINKDLTQLSAMFNYAEKHRWVAHNPTKHVKKLPQSKEARRRQLDGNTLTPAEVRLLIEAAGSPRDRVLFRMAVETGMRQGELLALRWEDVDWAGSRVYVRRSYRKGIESDPKTAASQRFVGLTPSTVSELRAWKLACPQPPGSLGLVFPNSRGGYERHYNLLRRNFWPALRRAGLRRIRFHDLRHTCGSWLTASGVGIKEVQAHLGHASAQITLDVYSHLLPGTPSAGAAAMATLLGGSKAVAEGPPAAAAETPTRVCEVVEMPIRTRSDAVAEVVARGGIEPPTRGFSVRCRWF